MIPLALRMTKICPTWDKNALPSQGLRVIGILQTNLATRLTLFCQTLGSRGGKVLADHSAHFRQPLRALPRRAGDDHCECPPMDCPHTAQVENAFLP